MAVAVPHKERKKARMRIRYELGQRKKHPELAKVREELRERGIKNPDAWISTFGLKVPPRSPILDAVSPQKRIPLAYGLQKMSEKERTTMAQWIREGWIKSGEIGHMNKFFF